jgi:hypothetical protein
MTVLVLQINPQSNELCRSQGRKGKSIMLRITIQPTADETTFKLEGKLGGPWVQELERLWQRVRQNALHRPVRVDMTSVLFVDQDGKRVLKAMHEDGAELVAEDAFMRSVIEEIMIGKRSTEMSKRADRRYERRTSSIETL